MKLTNCQKQEERKKMIEIRLIQSMYECEIRIWLESITNASQSKRSAKQAVTDNDFKSYWSWEPDIRNGKKYTMPTSSCCWTILTKQINSRRKKNEELKQTKNKHTKEKKVEHQIFIENEFQTKNYVD